MATTPPPEHPDFSSPSGDGPGSSPDEIGRHDFIAMAGLVAMVVALFWKALFTSDMLYFRDVFNYSYPHARLIHEICRRGQLPYWNPFLNWGQALLANPNTLFFYPYTLFIVILPVNIAYPLHYVVHFSIAALGVYLLARRWNQSIQAAFFAAGFFALSGPVLSLGNFYNMAACAAWIPWALLLTDHAIESRSLRPWILLAAVFSLQFTAGEPMTLMATFGLATFYAFHRKGNLRKPLAISNFRILLRFFCVGVSMLAIVAVSLLPSISLLQNSRRGNGLTFWQAGYWSFHPLLLLEVIIPNFFGQPLDQLGPWKLVLNSGAVPLLLSYFLGFVPLFLALVGWAADRRGRRNFLAGGVIVLFLLAFGRFTPLYEMLFWAFPPLRLVRFPVKLLVPAYALISLLAGWGFDGLHRHDACLTKRWKLAAAPLGFIFTGALVVWTISWIEPEWISAPARWVLVRTDRIFTVPPDKLLSPTEVYAATQNFLTMVHIHFPGLIGYSLGAMAWLSAFRNGKAWARRATPWIALMGIALLFYVNYNINPTAPKRFFDYQPPVLAHMQDSGQPYRFCDISHDRTAAHRARPVANFVNFDSVPAAAGFSGTLLSTFREKILLAAGTMLTGEESATSSDVDASVSEPYYQFWGFERAQVKDKARYDCLLGRANVKYLISRTPEDSPASRKVDEIFNGSTEPSYLYESLCAMPRAYATASALYSTNTDETLKRLSDSTYDAAGQVILFGDAQGAARQEEARSAGSVHIIQREPASVTLLAELQSPGYVVLLDRFDPNWHATLDGHEVRIWRANILFRAVPCPAGRHEIHFFYRQNGVKTGALISGVTILLLALIFWRDAGFRNLRLEN